MDYSRVFAISAQGMAFERARVEAAALNLANAHSAQVPGSLPYQPLRVVAQAQAMFSGLVDRGLGGSPAPGFTVEATNASPRRVHEPGHPLADERGFVSYPGVDLAGEMVGLMSATRAYEANVAAMNTARALALKSLEIGRAG